MFYLGIFILMLVVLYMILAALLSVFGFAYGTPISILEQFIHLVFPEDSLLGSFLLIAFPIGALVFIIISKVKQKKRIAIIPIGIMLLIIYGPMNLYLKHYIEKGKENFNISDYVEYDESFDVNSPYYYELVPAITYDAAGNLWYQDAFQTTVYNESILKDEKHLITYKFEIKNVIDDRETILDLAHSFEDVYGLEEAITYNALNNYSEYKYLLPVHEDDYDYFLLTYVYSIEVEAGTYNKDYSLGEKFLVYKQDKDIKFPSGTNIKVDVVNYTRKLKEEDIDFNKPYVGYVFISVPKVYKEYNLSIESNAFEPSTSGRKIVFDFREFLESFGIEY